MYVSAGHSHYLYDALGLGAGPERAVTVGQTLHRSGLGEHCSSLPLQRGHRPPRFPQGQRRFQSLPVLFKNST